MDHCGILGNKRGVKRRSNSSAATDGPEPKVSSTFVSSSLLGEPDYAELACHDWAFPTPTFPGTSNSALYSGSARTVAEHPSTIESEPSVLSVKEIARCVVHIRGNFGKPCPGDAAMGSPECPAHGTGIIFAKNHIITCAHVVGLLDATLDEVVEKKHQVQFTSYGGVWTGGDVLCVDRAVDLALIKSVAPLDDFPIMTLDSRSAVEMGDTVRAMGAPRGELPHTLTQGIVSCTGRPGKDILQRNERLEYYQTDASATYGFSGGPLLKQGKAVGMIMGGLVKRSRCSIHCPEDVELPPCTVSWLDQVYGFSYALPTVYIEDFIRRAQEKRTETSHVTRDITPRDWVFKDESPQRNADGNVGQIEGRRREARQIVRREAPQNDVNVLASPWLERLRSRSDLPRLQQSSCSPCHPGRDFFN